jgi:hypothetical protein
VNIIELALAALTDTGTIAAPHRANSGKIRTNRGVAGSFIIEGGDRERSSGNVYAVRYSVGEDASLTYAKLLKLELKNGVIV